MEIRARVRNRASEHEVTPSTGGIARSLVIAPKQTGPGSSVIGGELLARALATRCCNDLHREAAAGIDVHGVEVEARTPCGWPCPWSWIA